MKWPRWFKGYLLRLAREGRLFHRLLAECESRQYASLDELRRYQNEQLQKMVRRAYADVPYYRALFDRLGLTPDAIQSVDDLAKLPILRKEEIRGREQEWVSQRTRIKFSGTTSGTTGTPLVVYRDLYSINMENAMLWRQWRWAGFGFHDKRATLRHELVVPAEQTQPPFWSYVPSHRQLLMSSYHLSDATIPAYLEKLRQFQPDVIEAFASSVYRLATYMEAYKEAPIPVKAVITSSERVFPYQIELIEKYFGQVYDFYGNAERVAYICMCEQGNYHYAMDYSIVEFIPTTDMPGANPNEEGLYEIVGTSLHNAAMPLMRYATGDLVRLNPDPCPCGRAFPRIDVIEGRTDDYVITPSGRWIGRLNRVFTGVPHIFESQIIQETLDTVRILIIPAPDFSEQDLNLVMKQAQERIGPDVRVTVEKVKEIARTAQGKHKVVISHVHKNLVAQRASVPAE